MVLGSDIISICSIGVSGNMTALQAVVTVSSTVWSLGTYTAIDDDNTEFLFLVFNEMPFTRTPAMRVE